MPNRPERSLDVPDLAHRGRTTRLLQVAVGVPAALALVVVIVARQSEVVARGRLLDFLGDHTVSKVRILGADFYVNTSGGTGDELTALMLTGMGAVLLAAAVLLRERPGPRRSVEPLTAAGLGVLYLGLDEILAVHETIGNNVAFLRDLPLVDHPDDAIIAIYAVIVAAFVWRHRDLMRAAPVAPWVAGAILAAIAVLHDLSRLHYERFENQMELLAATAFLVGAVTLARAHLTPSTPAATRELATRPTPGDVPTS